MLELYIPRATSQNQLLVEGKRRSHNDHQYQMEKFCQALGTRNLEQRERTHATENETLPIKRLMDQTQPMNTKWHP